MTARFNLKVLLLSLWLLASTTLTQLPLESKAQVEDYIISRAIAYNYSVVKTLAIATCESGMKQFVNGKVLSGQVNNKDKGIFQINENYHLDRSQKLGLDIHTTQGNIEYALWLLESEGDKHWSASKPCWKLKLSTYDST